MEPNNNNPICPFLSSFMMVEVPPGVIRNGMGGEKTGGVANVNCFKEKCRLHIGECVFIKMQMDLHRLVNIMTEWEKKQ